MLESDAGIRAVEAVAIAPVGRCRLHVHPREVTLSRSSKMHSIDTGRVTFNLTLTYQTRRLGVPSGTWKSSDLAGSFPRCRTRFEHRTRTSCSWFKENETDSTYYFPN